MPELSHLDLSYNQLEWLSIDAKDAWPNLAWLDVMLNHLKQIEVITGARPTYMQIREIPFLSMSWGNDGAIFIFCPY